MRILWLTNIPSPYRVKFFNELGKRCDLTVLFERYVSSERDDSWRNFNAENFLPVFMSGKSVGVAEAFCPSVIKYLNKSYDHIVVTNFSDPTGILAVIMLKLKGIPYEIESDGAFPGTGKGIKELFKRFLISGATGYFSTAQLHDEYYKLYGARDFQIVRYPFSSVCDKDILDEAILKEQKITLRKELGIEEQYMVLAVGQFIHRKGFDVLVNATARLNDRYGIYIVGGQTPEEYKRLVLKLNLGNVHFVDFKQPDELDKYYEAADVFVHPTREDIWGLVINEAMSKGLPVVTTERCIAGLELVKNGKNGYIIPVEDNKALAEAIQNCVLNCDTMSREALNEIKDYTIENMALKHIAYWNINKELRI